MPVDWYENASGYVTIQCISFLAEYNLGVWNKKFDDRGIFMLYMDDIIYKFVKHLSVSLS